MILKCSDKFNGNEVTIQNRIIECLFDFILGTKKAKRFSEI